MAMFSIIAWILILPNLVGARVIRLLLLGETRLGKSTLANHIFDQEVFEVGHGEDSKTGNFSCALGDLFGEYNGDDQDIEIYVCDTPGYPGYFSVPEPTLPSEDGVVHPEHDNILPQINFLDRSEEVLTESHILEQMGNMVSAHGVVYVQNGCSVRQELVFSPLFKHFGFVFTGCLERVVPRLLEATMPLLMKEWFSITKEFPMFFTGSESVSNTQNNRLIERAIGPAGTDMPSHYDWKEDFNHHFKRWLKSLPKKPFRLLED